MEFLLGVRGVRPADVSTANVQPQVEKLELTIRRIFLGRVVIAEHFRQNAENALFFFVTAARGS